MNFKMTKAVLILFTTVNTCYNLNPRRSGALRVISGSDVSPGQLTYVVRIELYLTIHILKTNETNHLYDHKCTGSVISQTATLTAGHCCSADLNKLKRQVKKGIAFVTNAKYIVRYGSAPDKPDHQRDKFSDVLKKTRPPAGWGAEHPLFSDDLAILTTEPIQLRRYGKLSSLDYPSLLGLAVIVTGYGATSHNRSYTDTLTLSLPLQVIDGMLAQCAYYEKFGKKSPLLCTQSLCGNPHGIIGPGDSGGPVIHSTGIVGVSLISLFNLFRKVDPKYIPVYFQAQVMPLSPYIDWLTRTLQQNTTSQIS